MDDDARLVRRPTDAELADVAAMHEANRTAWDEAAERYEAWFDEAVALIRSGGTNLFGVETELIGDLHGRSTSSAPAVATRCRCGTRVRTR
jgi:hypothetical protein